MRAVILKSRLYVLRAFCFWVIALVHGELLSFPAWASANKTCQVQKSDLDSKKKLLSNPQTKPRVRKWLETKISKLEAKLKTGCPELVQKSFECQDPQFTQLFSEILKRRDAIDQEYDDSVHRNPELASLVGKVERYSNPDYEVKRDEPAMFSDAQRAEPFLVGSTTELSKYVGALNEIEVRFDERLKADIGKSSSKLDDERLVTYWYSILTGESPEPEMKFSVLRDLYHTTLHRIERNTLARLYTNAHANCEIAHMHNAEQKSEGQPSDQTTKRVRSEVTVEGAVNSNIANGARTQ